MKVEIKNLEKAAKRILSAVKNKERIIIYGDADLDGVASVVILQEGLKTLGAEIAAVYFPDREKEGYGISEAGLEYLKKYAPALFITLDLGISNFKEVKIANKLGFEVIIVDHHEVLGKLPKASIIVDPKQKGDRYPFKQFAAAGLAFKLAEALLKGKMPEAMRKNFLELVAQATISDMMPRTDENEIMIAEGLSYLESSWRPGTQVLLGLDSSVRSSLAEKVQRINSLLNVRDMQEQLPLSYRILVASSQEEATKLANQLFEKQLQRKQKVRAITETLESKIARSEGGPIIFEGDSDWEVTLLGIVASNITQKYQKPVFLFKKGEKESHGGIRAPSGYNVVEAMKKFSKRLITYGGHPQAAGFRLKNEDLEDFKQCLVEYFEKRKNQLK